MLLAGLINIDKPAGWTSHDVVAKIRGLLRSQGIQRVGHTGTLDPMATGVLPICFGAATKMSSYVMEGDKEYNVTCQFGQETDTGDITGKVLRTCDLPAFSMETLSAALSSFMGTTMQTPPIYSAIKVRGVPMYRLARKGIDVERTPRPITIQAIRLNHFDEAHMDFNVVCSKGTYIRTLCADIGIRLGVLGCANAIRRLRSGPFSIDQAIPLDQFIQRGTVNESDVGILSLAQALEFLPQASLGRKNP